MTECSACGAEISAHETRCPVCGRPTVYYHRQRRCLHCGAPAAEQATTCMMCGQPVDSLPLRSSILTGSWWGIGLGVIIIVGLVIVIQRYQTAPPETVAVQTRRPTATTTATPTPLTPSPTKIATATATPTATPTPFMHQVERGESLFYLADLYRVDLDELIAANNIEEAASLRVGQQLIIPASAFQSRPAPIAGLEINYTVQSGDTLLNIAQAHNTTVEAIVAVNPDKDLDVIYPGQEIIIPLATPTPTLTFTPEPTATPTPGPPYAAPNLLWPPDGAVIEAETILFQWTAGGVLGPEEFYVLRLNWADGSQTEYWTKSAGRRMTKAKRPANGRIRWTVLIMRRGSATRLGLIEPSPPRTVEWR